MLPRCFMQSQIDESVKYTECGTEHTECPNAIKGKCDRPEGHGGSHHCHECNATW